MTADVFEGWVGGFLTGSNFVLSNSPPNIDIFARATDAQGLWAWVDNYCQSHPLESVATAADALGGELIRRGVLMVKPK